MSDAQKRDLVGRVQTQALYGTSVIVLGSSGSWSKVAVSTQPSQKDPSGYPGWVPTVQLTFIPPATASVQAIVTSRTAWLYASSERAGGRRLMELSYDTRLPVVRSTDAGVEVVALDGRHRALARDDVALRSPSATRANALGEARKFTGLPYLWGGTSGFGYDCSGFTYSVYHVLGETTSRDADRQALEGRPVPIDSLQPGDLLFVANSRGSIVHNAMYYGVVGGVRSIIESPSTGTPLRVVPLSTHTYVGARRHLSG